MSPDTATDETRRLFRHWKRWLIAGVVTVAVLAVAGPYVYIHYIEGPAPSRFSLSKTSRSKSNGAAVPLAGAWKIASGSQAGYRIGEVLFPQKHTLVGRTPADNGHRPDGERCHDGRPRHRDGRPHEGQQRFRATRRAVPGSDHGDVAVPVHHVHADRSAQPRGAPHRGQDPDG